MRRIFISDLHLEDPASPQFQRFTELMATESPRVDEIYLLGDVVEMWVGDDDDSPTAVTLKTVLQATSQHCTVYLMHGNRDFLFGADLARATGVHLLPDPSRTDDGILLSHGDAACTDDVAYQQMRTMFRSAAWQAEILDKSLAERKTLGQGLRAQSKATNANKTANIMDVNAEAIRAMSAEHDARVLIHGHTHRPGIHPVAGDGKRFVLGAWERCGWLCRQQDADIQLECFSLARRYGT